LVTLGASLAIAAVPCAAQAANGANASDGGVVASPSRADEGVSLRPHFEVAGAHFVSVLGGWQGREIGFGSVATVGLELGVSRRFGLEARLFGAGFLDGSDPSDPSLRPASSAGFYGGGLGFRSHPFAVLEGAWFGGALSYARTGDVGRVAVDLRVGWDFRPTARTELGPYVGFLQVIEPDSTTMRPQDARAVMLGLHVGFDEGPPVVAPPPPIKVVAPPTPTPPKKLECPPGKVLDEGASHCVDVPPPPPAPELCADGSVASGPTGCPMAVDEVKVVGDEIVLGDRIYFDLGLSTIKPKSLPMLANLAKLILDHPEYVLIRVQGHTDETGPDELNQKLSEDRAASVVRVLVDLGVPAARLQAQGFGKQRPRASGGTREARQENRRVEFLIERRQEVKP
jgi:outer membrane protein OmpA-like peptidoglycan-associated protein